MSFVLREKEHRQVHLKLLEMFYSKTFFLAEEEQSEQHSQLRELKSVAEQYPRHYNQPMVAQQGLKKTEIALGHLSIISCA